MAATGQLTTEHAQRDGSLLAGVRRLAALADRADEPQPLLRALAREAQGLLGADEIHVHHLSGTPQAAAQELVAVYLFGGEGSLSYLSEPGERPPGVNWVATTGRSFLAASERELAASVPRLAAASGAHEQPVSGALLLPLIVRGQIEAVVVMVTRRSGGFPEDPGAEGGALRERAATLVVQVATGLALVRARAEAGTDAVTGCMNHRAMRRRLVEEAARAQRTGGRLACLLIDLDDFKLVNDRHGHAAGDAVLREVARALVGEFRAFDRVARYGGDEFVVILPEATVESAVRAGARALERLRHVDVVSAAEGVRASIGAAEWQAPMSADELLEACDQALLRGKREAKGRVTRALPDS